MQDEVSETENIRKNLAIERMIVEGCDILLDVNQTFVRQGKKPKQLYSMYIYTQHVWKSYGWNSYKILCSLALRLLHVADGGI